MALIFIVISLLNLAGLLWHFVAIMNDKRLLQFTPHLILYVFFPMTLCCAGVRLHAKCDKYTTVKVTDTQVVSW